MQRGFTFIEVLVWTGVFVAAMIALTVFLISFYRSNAYTIEQSAAVENARKGIERSVAMMRETTYGSDGAYPIHSMDPNEFVFYSDIDQDAFIERVRFFLEDTDFKMGVTEPSGMPLSYNPANEVVSVVSSEVRNTMSALDVFTYYDTNGIVITDFGAVTDVRFVRVDLVVNINPNRLPNQLTLRSSATLRNLVGR